MSGNSKSGVQADNVLSSGTDFQLECFPPLMF